MTALPWSGNVVPIAPFCLRKGSSLIAPDQNPLGRYENSDAQFIVIVRDKNAQKVATMSVIEERFTTPNIMQRFLVYRCPNTGMKVQASFVCNDGKEAEDRSELYETAYCPACGSVHFVNLRTGKLLGEKIKKWFQQPKRQ